MGIDRYEMARTCMMMVGLRTLERDDDETVTSTRH
jgi:hypothetical protein